MCIDSEILDHVLKNPKRETFILQCIRHHGKESFPHFKNRRTGRSVRDVLDIVKSASISYNEGEKVIVVCANLREIDDHKGKIVKILSILNADFLIENIVFVTVGCYEECYKENKNISLRGERYPISTVIFSHHSLEV